MANNEEQIIEGSGNVFADLGMSDADELLVCAELSHLIHVELRRRKLTPNAAARLLDIDIAEAQQLIAGHFVRSPTDHLLHLLTALDRDVDIVVRPRAPSQSRPRLRVVSEAA
jgi:predicted XRE-type DNA-binding protein